MFKKAHFFTFSIAKDTRVPGRWSRLDLTEHEIKMFMTQYKKMLKRIIKHIPKNKHFRSSVYRPTATRRARRCLTVMVTCGIGTVYFEKKIHFVEILYSYNFADYFIYITKVQKG